jgi:peptidoglycan/LPS O-acetylase OafA/YrhL
MMDEKQNSQPSATQVPIIRPIMPELDAIRGLAILGVLFYHGFYWHIDIPHFPLTARTFLTLMWTGRMGVELFFVLSGFLITGILLRSVGEKTYYQRFYLRRALRIFPIYLLILLVLLVVRYAPVSFIVLSLLYLSNLTPLFGVPMAYAVLWSLAVEEHFYFLWPMLVRRFSKSSLVAVCFFVIAIVPLSRLATFYATFHNGLANYVSFEFTWNALDGIACGAVLSIWINSFAVSRRRLLILSSILLAISVLMWVALWSYGILSFNNPVGAALQLVPWHLAFTSLLGLFLLIGSSNQRKLVQPGFLRFFGEISYGLYLVHVLMFDVVDYLGKHGLRAAGTSTLTSLLLRFGLASTMAIVIAFVSRRYLENPFLALKSRYT